VNDQLEAELRAAFAVRAAEVPPGAVERLCRIDYRPRTGRRWPLTVSMAGVASGTAAVVSVVMLGGSQAAFAGWSPTPAAADLQGATQDMTQAAAAVQADCQPRLSSVPGGAGQGGWTEVGSDVRGPYTMTVYEKGSILASCFTGPSFTEVQAQSLRSADGGMAVSVGGGIEASSGATPARSTAVSAGERLLSGGAVDELAVSHLWQSANGSFTLVEGRLAPSAQAVTLVLSDGQDVTATTGDGWLIAWWPGSQDVTAARITTAGGTTTEALTGATPPAPDTSAPVRLPGGGTSVPPASATP